MQKLPIDHLRLGVVPIGKFVFSHEDALRQKAALFDQLSASGIMVESIDTVIPDGMVRYLDHVRPAVEHLRQARVDAVLLPHCNFGTESAVGMLGKELGVPVLLWGPRDGAPMEDGTRLRDSLCGLLASSKVLHKLRVPFSYIENCAPDAPVFQQGLDTFLRAAAVAKTIRTLRVGFAGSRVDFFWSTITNEGELLDRFGIQVEPVDLVSLIRDTRERLREARKVYEEELRSHGEWLDVPGQAEVREGMLHGLALRDILLRTAESRNFDSFAVQSFFSLRDELGPGFALGLGLAEENLPIAVESDLHGAISSSLLRAASRVQAPVFFPEFTSRHPENDNAVLLWHGSAPPSLRHPETSKVTLREPWILKKNLPASLQFRLRDGDLTVCRFDGDGNGYRLGFGEGRTVDGPVTRDFYAWLEVGDWPEWERRLIEGPYIHHCSAVYDRCADALELACRFIPHLDAERFGRDG